MTASTKRSAGWRRIRAGQTGDDRVRQGRARPRNVLRRRFSAPPTRLHVDVAGGFPTAQYVHDIVEVEGLRYPTKRFAYVRGPNLKPIRDLLLVSIKLSNFRLTT